MVEMFGSQWFAKALIVATLLVASYFILKPIKSAQHLAMRRLTMMVFVVFAVVAALFPALLSYTAAFLGIGRGTDLLLYALTLAFFSTIVTAYRRDAAAERKFTKLARTIALATVQDGEESDVAAQTSDREE